MKKPRESGAGGRLNLAHPEDLVQVHSQQPNHQQAEHDGGNPGFDTVAQAVAVAVFDFDSYLNALRCARSL